MWLIFGVSIFLLKLPSCQTLPMLGSCFVNGIVSPSISRANSVTFCSNEDGGSSLIFGRFTGNDFIDIFCHRNSTGGMTLFNMNSIQVLSIARTFCEGGWRLMTADLNGDSNQDLVCLRADGSVSYLLNTDGGTFLTAAEQNINASFTCNKTLIFGDINGDNKDDIVCQNEDGIIHFALTNSSNLATGLFTSQHTFPTSWCNGTMDQIMKGDLNGDGKIDLLCHAERTYLRSALISSGESFEEELFEMELEVCGDENQFLLVRDINGDGYVDLVCKSSDLTGTTKIIHNKPGEYFTDQSVRNEFRFCVNGGPTNFYVEDVNRDGFDDLVCQTSIAKRYIFISRCYF